MLEKLKVILCGDLRIFLLDKQSVEKIQRRSPLNLLN